MYPGKTVMDLVGGNPSSHGSLLIQGQSLAMALYFASRGIGQICNKCDAHSEPYTSTARVLLNGLGSDELLGGYGRHRTVFTQGGWQAVIDEVMKS